MKNKVFIFLAVGGLIFSHIEKAKAQTDQSQLESKADSILSLMTLQEKIGQLNLPSAGEFTTGQASSSDIAQKIKDGSVGGLFNIKSAAKIRDVQKVAMEESRLKIPLLFGMDVIHGYETVFPIPLGMSTHIAAIRSEISVF